MSAAHDTALHGEARAANFLGAMFAALSKEIETLWDHHARKMESSLARQSPAIEHADMHRETRLLASVPELIESMRLRAAAIKESHDAASQEAPIEALQRDVRDASEQPRSHARQEHAHNHSVSHACDKRSPPHQKQELLADPIFQISEIDLCALIGRASGNDIVPSPKKIADIAADLELRSAAAAESARFKIRTNAILKAFLDRLLRLTRTGSVEFSAIAAGSGSAAFGAQVFSLPESETDLRAQIEAESQKFQRSCTQIAYLKDLLEHVMRESEEQRTAYLHEVIALRDQINKAENFGRGKSGQAAQSVPHFLQNHLNKISPPEREALHHIIALERERNSKLSSVIARLKAQLAQERLRDDAAVAATFAMGESDALDADPRAALESCQRSKAEAIMQVQTLRIEMSARDARYAKQIEELKAEITRLRDSANPKEGNFAARVALRRPSEPGSAVQNNRTRMFSNEIFGCPKQQPWSQHHLLFGDPLGMPDNMELQLSDTGQPGQLLDEEHQVFDSRQIVVIDIAEEAEQDSNTQKELSSYSLANATPTVCSVHAPLEGGDPLPPNHE
ncbi:hypothetical protein HK105_200591 [Polyrhizophydium stewartii]|uniref:Uncharacterized protein n=1 Tax=Polyrhizophydium stewartii TaxID=2732419 RepID=A0ABR4NJI0_9FUNG